MISAAEALQPTRSPRLQQQWPFGSGCSQILDCLAGRRRCVIDITSRFSSEKRKNVERLKDLPEGSSRLKQLGVSWDWQKTHPLTAERFKNKAPAAVVPKAPRQRGGFVF